MAIEVPAVAGKIINLGRAGENLATTVVFDVSSWVEEFGTGGTFNLAVQQGTNEYYPQEVTGPENGKVNWEVTNSNTAIVGLGKCELVYTKTSGQDNIIVKSMIYDIMVTNSLDIGEGAEPPDPIQNWIDHANEVLAEVQDTADWVVGPGGTPTEPSSTNNAQYYMEQADNYAEAAADSAEDAENSAEAAQTAENNIKSLTVSETTTTNAGANASVSLNTTTTPYSFNFTIPKGSQWFSGNKSGSSPGIVTNAKTNDYYLDTSNGQVWKCSSNSGNSWTSVGNIRGAIGPDGVSPTLSSSKTGKTTTIYYTDATHTSSTVLATILDGADGMGSGNMNTATYDTHNKAQDIYDYADTKISAPISSSNGDVLTYNGSTWIAQTPASDMFIAVYGTTSFEDLNTAYNAGKAIYLKWDSSSTNIKIVPLTSIESGTYYFKWVNDTNIHYRAWRSSTAWNNSSTSLVTTSRTINNKPLSSNITLDSSDVGAIEDPSNKADGDILTYNGSSWIAQSPGSGSSGVFVCEYGVTPVTDIETAYQAEKMIFVQATTDTTASNYNADLAGCIFILNQRFAADDFVFHSVAPWRFGNTETTTSLRCTVAYTAVVNPSGNPQEQGWFILENNGRYILTTDTSVVSGTTYYIKTSTTSWTILHQDFGGGQTLYCGTCSTASSTVEKTISISSFPPNLYNGMVFRILFSNANTASSPTLSINNNTAYPIQYISGTNAIAYDWNAGAVLDLYFTGSAFIISHGGHATTTYYGVTKLSSSTSSTSTSFAATPSAVKAAYDLASQKEATITTISSATSLSSDHYNHLLLVTATCTLTIPASLTVGSEIEIMNYNSNITITVKGASGVYLNGTSGGSKTITEQYTSAVLKCVSTDHWVIQGAIS